MNLWLIPAHTVNFYNNVELYWFIPVYTGNMKKFDELRKGILGLSLCIQGTFKLSIHLYENNRFIPVYTGNIAFILTTLYVAPVYPCVYREHL